ncbi:MAG TPA: hypothetical protein VG056_00990 [Pirellulales bacterium]|jgi:hypothetical protein|nr:hypothetical protein [Pirellulales bacterium]
MYCSAEIALRGVPLTLARQRLTQISQIARESRGTDVICRHWPNSRFDRIERLASTLLESPPADLSAMAMDELELLRSALQSNMSRFTDLLEDVRDKPDWRLAYLCYFVPFALAVLCDATWGR